MKELRQYETFSSIEEMDQTIHKALNTYELKNSERAVLLKLSQYSCRFVGVSYLKTSSLAEAVGLSQRTIKRCLRSLSELGIITRVNQLRPLRGGWGASITVINSPKSHLELSQGTGDETPEVATDEESTQETETIISKAKKPLKDIKDVSKEVELDYTYLENGIVPESYIKAVKPFISSAKEIYSLWKKACSASSQYAPSVIEITETAIQAFKQTVFAKKMNKIKKDFNGFYYGCLVNMLTERQRKVDFKPRPHFYNWLEN